MIISFFVISLISILCSCLNPYLYYSSPRARRHPAEYYYIFLFKLTLTRIFVAISLTEITCSYHLMMWSIGYEIMNVEFKLFQIAKYLDLGNFDVDVYSLWRFN